MPSFTLYSYMIYDNTFTQNCVSFENFWNFEMHLFFPRKKDISEKFFAALSLFVKIVTKRNIFTFQKHLLCLSILETNMLVKKLSTKHRLKTHVERHTGKKEVYKCHLCDKYFTWKDSFNAHMKRKHSDSLLVWYYNIFL